MLLIDNITNSANQKNELKTANGKPIVMQILYSDIQRQWIVNTLDYNNGEFIANGLSIKFSSNLLDAWSRVIPFGLACSTITRLDPFLQNDFENGVAELFLLNENDLLLIEEQYAEI